MCGVAGVTASQPIGMRAVCFEFLTVVKRELVVSRCTRKWFHVLSASDDVLLAET